jgi:hypothetical protein
MMASKRVVTEITNNNSIRLKAFSGFFRIQFNQIGFF